MKTHVLTILIGMFFTSYGIAQSLGDTIVIETFDYNSTTRDTVIDFSVLPNVSFEKVLMKYNIRCKDGAVNTTGGNGVACGEWDYSCNTYLHDSSRIDSVRYFTPDYTVSSYSGTTFSYTSQPTNDFYQFTQFPIVVNNIISENQYPLLTTLYTVDHALDGTNQSGKSQYLYSAGELTAAGFTAGNIDAMLLSALTAGSIHFLRVKIKGTTANTLDPNAPELTGFTEVFFSDYDFIQGSNRLQFITPFVWNGTDNIIIEFSFTNTVPTNLVELEGELSSGKSLVANNGYNMDLSAETMVGIPTTNMSSIQNEITVSFWAYGDPDLLPANTSIIHANNAAGARNLNLHLPWSNSRIYFDCGNTGAGYDRIDKAANTNEFEGQWNHWAATKNTATGVMNLYLNGVLWHSGTGKTTPIELAEMVIGKSNAGTNNYKGRIDELRIWNTELSQTEIANWMNIYVDATHPQYANLVAYYKMDEGTGALISDGANGQVGTSSSPYVWMYDRGNKLERFFQAADARPSIILLNGVYDTTITPTIVLDSVERFPNVIEYYAINSNAGTLMDDDIVSTGSLAVWHATPEYIYDGETGTLIDSINVVAENTTPPVTNLPYYRRWPQKFEIMSFVTPYGIGLNMGMTGETWTFDLTDYSPIFNGQKRMTIERGGEWQEDMDIRFEFIVGTPPRDVLDVRQIWRPESRGYVSIMDDTYFPPRDLMMDGNASSFKVRSAITGHGQEGEFIQRQHQISVNGGTQFAWNVWKECAENPIYPQGGTWIYDRAGWCPGMATDIQHFDITPYVTPGQTATIDYTVATASGTSNYIVNNQLVTYGAINHSLDASILEISEPSTRVEFKRFNSICHSPKVTIQNTGSTTLTSLTITYWVNSSITPQTYNWTGSLEFGETEVVTLPSNYDLWSAINPSNNVFNAEVSAPNGGVDEYTYNNYHASAFEIPEVMPSNIVIWFKTNNVPGESSYQLLDEYDNVVFARSGMAANTLYKDTLNLGLGCYKYLVNDTGDDGIDFWANNDGTGYTRFFSPGVGNVKIFDGDFGDNINYNFTVGFPLSYDEVNGLNDWNLFPNPASTEFTIEGKNVHEAIVKVFNNQGKQVEIPFSISNNRLSFNSNGIAEGIYFVQLEIDEKVETMKVIVE